MQDRVERANGIAANGADPGVPIENAVAPRLTEALRHYRAGRLDEAQVLCRELLPIAPENADLLHLLGALACRERKFEEGTQWLRAAIKIAPDSPEMHVNLGNALLEQRQYDDAHVSYRRALALKQDYGGAHLGLGMLAQALDRRADARTSYRKAALAFKEGRQAPEAMATYQRAINLDPEDAWAHNGIGNLHFDQGRITLAEACYRQALAADPKLGPAYNNVGLMLNSQGRFNEAIGFFRRSVELQPRDFSVRSNVLFALQNDPGMTPAAMLFEHRAYEASLGAVRLPPVPRSSDTEKRLKIGYVSPDLHIHPVGFFLGPVLTAHDRDHFAVYCYYGERRSDGMTAEFKKHAEVWRSTDGLDDDALAAMIRGDGIDILVDLAGHTGSNRLPVFARKPAPVQVTWAGYVGTTGLSAIDYLITDRWHTPPGSERYFVETLVPLPDGYVCWAVPGHAPDVGPLRATEPGAVTFGCFNNLTKLNYPVIALWGRLLRELASARLLWKTGALGEEPVRQRVTELFAIEGIDPTRVILEGRSPHPELLARYNDIDIALDPFPYSGGVTTIEALWMGVPVVTMPGERFCSRHSLSHLSNVGLTELVANGPEEYLRIAIELANDLPRLASLRGGMRDRLRASPLLQARQFTRGLEAAYRAMWRAWCGNTALS